MATKKITPEIFENICNDLGNTHEGLKYVLKKYGVFDSEFYPYLNEECANKEYKISRYTRAKEDQIQHLADEINRLTYEMADMVRKGGIYDEISINPAVKTMQIQVDSLKWQLSKLAPKKYGDKLGIEHEGNVNHVVTGMKIV